MKAVFGKGETKAGKSYLIDRPVSALCCLAFADVHNFFWFRKLGVLFRKRSLLLFN
jgi:hypothetical protein